MNRLFLDDILGRSDKFCSSECWGFVNTVTNNFSVKDLEDIFARSGSATRIKELESIFNDSKHRYGRGLDWETGNFDGRDPKTKPTLYDVYDAASCLLRYLKLLPEPVIPFDFYDQFTAAIGDKLPPEYAVNCVLPDDFDISGVIERCQQATFSLPPVNRQLLLYLLDLLAVFAYEWDRNHMTSPRIVAAFQPALLSRPPSEMSASDHVLAADTMIFLVENQDNFLIGMKDVHLKDEEPANIFVELTDKPATA
jgi:hypothetical protein